jgi:UDP-N-acetylglucosamine 4,6-dehydratase
MRIFISGITGTLGTALAKYHHANGDTVFGCARNESKVVQWMIENGTTTATVFVTDAITLTNKYSDCGRILHSMDRLYHCSAMKHVDICEKQPIEAFYQNATIAERVASACRMTKVPMVFISSDKACMPQGVYGATKLIAERAVLSHGGGVVRLGNIIGSSGSVFKIWKDSIDKGLPVNITDREMTRYFISVEDATKFVVNNSASCTLAIPLDMKSARMGLIAEILRVKYSATINIIGMRVGETLDQWLVAPGELELVDNENKTILLCSSGTPSKGRNSSFNITWLPHDLLKIAGVI